MRLTNVDIAAACQPPPSPMIPRTLRLRPGTRCSSRMRTGLKGNIDNVICYSYVYVVGYLQSSYNRYNCRKLSWGWYLSLLLKQDILNSIKSQIYFKRTFIARSFSFALFILPIIIWFNGSKKSSWENGKLPGLDQKRHF